MSQGTIMLVPGFSGSELSTPRSLFGLGPSIKVWLNYGALVAGAWRWLNLAADGQTPTFPGVGAIYPGPALGSYYGQMGTFFTKAGWNVVSASLDWREMLTLDGVRLADQIADTALYDPVSVIAHSRGGLVTRIALQVLAQRGQLSRVAQVVGLGVPHEGSWEAASLLSGFQTWARLTRHLLDSIPGSLTGDLLFGSFQETVWSWPSIYELLPAPFASGVDPTMIDAIYDQSRWAEIGRPVSAKWLDAARLAWTTLPNPQGVPWLDVVGYGVETPYTLTSPEPPSTSKQYLFTFAGDGVVPSAWAQQAGRQRIESPTAHNALVYDRRALALVNSYLQGSLSGNVRIDGPVLQ